MRDWKVLDHCRTGHCDQVRGLLDWVLSRGDGGELVGGLPPMRCRDDESCRGKRVHYMCSHRFSR